jgi:hypothetical protein
MEGTGDDDVELGGSTRVEFREFGYYFRQIIGNCLLNVFSLSEIK